MPLVNAGQRVTAGVLSTNYVNADLGIVTVTAATLTDLTASFTVPANDAVAGNIYEIEAWGNGVQGSTKETLEFSLTFASQAMQNVTFGTTAFEAVSQAFRWKVVARVVCLTNGSSGTFQSYIEAVTTDFGGAAIAPGNNNFGVAFSTDSTSTYTVDTTSAQGLKIQCAWGATTGAPTITKRTAMQRKWGIG